MKAYYKLIFLFSFCFLILSSQLTMAQCESDDFLDDCAELLDDYTFIKVFNIKTNKKTSKVEFSSVFSKDHSYIITICGGENPGGKKMVVNLYNRDKKLISSSYYKPKKMHVKKIGYKCTATGVYYIEASFEDGTPCCGVAILGFKKS